MKYRVAWDLDAFHELRRAWIAAEQPESGVRAFEAIEQVLQIDAHLRGESREYDRRILIEPPITVVFEARPEIGKVSFWTLGSFAAGIRDCCLSVGDTLVT